MLHHLEHPFLGNVEAPLRDAGLDLDERDLRRGDPLPDLQSVDGIVTLGGEQSVREIDSYPYLLEEVELLRRAVGAEVPVLGICLGSQLLAHALGGSVHRAPRRTVGWHSLVPREEAADDPLVRAAGNRVPALHWNEDVIELPPDAIELFDRPGHGVEAVRAGSCAWALQFHPDADSRALEGWYARGSQWLEQAGVDEETARAADARHMGAHGEASRAIFSAFAEVVRARSRATA